MWRLATVRLTKFPTLGNTYLPIGRHPTETAKGEGEENFGWNLEIEDVFHLT